MASPIIERMRAWFTTTQPLSHGAVLLVGVSGGPDSLCLLHVLAALREQLDFTLHAAHLNHQLRGADSDADAAFVNETARTWDVPVIVESIDVQAYAQRHRLNLHQAAREMRYRWLAELAHAHAAQAVAVAHNANDQAETVLMHLLRGAGSTGLRGMAAVSTFAAEHAPAKHNTQRQLTLLRPLLTTTRAEIDHYCRDQRLQPRHDATNTDVQYTRNRIRHELLPQLASFNPHIIDSLARTAAIAADEHDFLQQALDATWPTLVQTAPGMISFDGSVWRMLHPALQREALRRAYQHMAGMETLSWERLEQARHIVGRTGKRVELPGSIWLVAGYHGAFTLERSDRAPKPIKAPQLPGDEYPLTVPGSVALANGWVLTIESASSLQPSGSDKWHIALNADLLNEPLMLRRRRPGDRMQIGKGHGHRTLQDMFVDAKIPQPLRAAWPVITTNDAIIWVPGLHAAAAYIATARTRSIVRIQLHESHVEESI